MTSKNYDEESLEYLKEEKGGYKVVPTRMIKKRDELSVVYTPGIGEPVRRINKDQTKRFDYTSAGKTACVISDGTAVLGLGNVGAWAGKPVMEGKSSLITNFGSVGAMDVSVDLSDLDRKSKEYNDRFVDIIKRISGNYSALLLEDVAAPNCFDIETRLQKELDIPIFHDDQWGSAIVALAGLKNAVKITSKDKNMKIVVVGIGAGGFRTIYMLKKIGYNNILALGRTWDAQEKKFISAPSTLTVDSLPDGHFERKPQHKWAIDMLDQTEKLTLDEAMEGADMFVGLSVKGLVSKEMVGKMNDDPIVFPMANPDPEITEADSKGIVKVYANGRSDCVNQLNNVLYFPHALRGLIYCGANKFVEEMVSECVDVIANLVPQEKLDEGVIIPSPLDPRLTEISKKVIEIAIKHKDVEVRNSDYEKLCEMVDKDREELERRFS